MIVRDHFTVPINQVHIELLDAVHANDVETVKKIVSTLKSANVPLLDNALWVAEHGHDMRIYNHINDAIKRLAS